MAGMQKVPTSWKTGLQRMAPGVYAYIQAGGLNVSNAGLVVGDDEALVVDALYVRPMTQAFQESIRKATRKPVRKIACTHHHADHTLGLTCSIRISPSSRTATCASGWWKQASTSRTTGREPRARGRTQKAQTALSHHHL